MQIHKFDSIIIQSTNSRLRTTFKGCSIQQVIRDKLGIIREKK